jgi:hypothetical protein
VAALRRLPLPEQGDKVTRPDRFPLPSLADFANKLHGCCYFSVVDLVKGYHQIPMAAGDIAKMVVLLAIRTASRDEESPSPAELLYGAQLVVPGQFVAASEDPPTSDSFL